MAPPPTMNIPTGSGALMVKAPPQSSIPTANAQGQAPSQAQGMTQQLQLGTPPTPQGNAVGVTGAAGAGAGAAALSWTKPSPTAVANLDWSMYDYYPADDGGFWKLQPGFSASDQIPDLIPLAVTNRSPIQQHKKIEWTCLSPACPSQPFKSKPELDCHYKEMHADGIPSPAVSMVLPSFDLQAMMMAGAGAGTGHGTGPGIGGALAQSVAPPAAAPSPTTAGTDGSTGAAGKDNKEKEGTFYCDYLVCPRKEDGFNRKDRFRVHLRETHKEDVDKKGGKYDGAWLESRKMPQDWWRCTKCLERVKIEEHGWECPRDQAKCEKRRREYREKMRKGS